MNPSSFDRMLVDSGKTTLENDAAVRASLLALTRQVQSESSQPRRRVPRLLPALAVIGLAVTAGAAAWMTSVEPDVVIPVAYTTDAGRSVECVIYFEVPDADLRTYLNDSDWNGLGQRIYDQALSASLAPRDDLTFGSLQERESWAWHQAAQNLTLDTIPAELLPEKAVIAASDSSCTGDLH